MSNLYEQMSFMLCEASLTRYGSMSYSAARADEALQRLSPIRLIAPKVCKVSSIFLNVQLGSRYC